MFIDENVVDHTVHKEDAAAHVRMPLIFKRAEFNGRVFLKYAVKQRNVLIQRTG